MKEALCLPKNQRRFLWVLRHSIHGSMPTVRRGKTKTPMPQQRSSPRMGPTPGVRSPNRSRASRPFDGPGRRPPRGTTGIAFGCEPLAVTEDGRHIARWWASMKSVPASRSVRMEGIFLNTLTESGRCSGFREWWNEDPPATVASEFE